MPFPTTPQMSPMMMAALMQAHGLPNAVAPIPGQRVEDA